MKDPRPAATDSPLNRKVRAFLGIGPPPEKWLDALEEWLFPLQRRLFRSTISWTKRESLHLTLRFFGSISQGDVLEIQSEMAETASQAPAFQLESRELVFFPNLWEPKIIAAWLAEESGGLDQIVRRSRGALGHIGQKPETRAFVPHVTLGRVKSLEPRDQKIFADVWSEGAGPKLGVWPVSAVTLFRSDLQPGGSIYTPIGVFPLAGKSPAEEGFDA